jgi:hypothetical protein
MTLNDALNAIIVDDIEAARLDYAKPRDTFEATGGSAVSRTNLNFRKADVPTVKKPPQEIGGMQGAAPGRATILRTIPRCHLGNSQAPQVNLVICADDQP